MDLKLYHIDAFADAVFSGNPAAICPLESWLPDKTMQSIAMENNLSETAFFVREGERYHIRWFTPVDEVDLCGHATLASAYVLYRELGYGDDTISLVSRSGPLFVSRDNDWLTLDFPAQPPVSCEAPPELLRGFHIPPLEVLKSEDYFVVYENEDQIIKLNPDMNELKKLDLRGVIVTSPGRDVDFVSRFFAPALGIDEDPVTGSAHCELTPFWAKRLHKNRFEARQLSQRRGYLKTALKDDRVLISGKAVKYMEGLISI